MDDACGIVVLYYCITNHAGASLFANITATNWRFHLVFKVDTGKVKKTIKPPHLPLGEPPKSIS
jgi:hypothetical protein